MIKVRQSIPNFEGARTPAVAEISTLAELLALPWVNSWTNYPTFIRFSLSPKEGEDQLMCELSDGSYVVGFIPKGHHLDLPDLKTTKLERPTWDEYFLAMTKVVATRATCDRKSIGAIIVDKRHRITSTGYNGAAKGMPHCSEVGHLMKEVDGRDSCVRTLHAESNALDDAGRRAEGGTIYVTVIPCFNCALRIVNAGIRRVVWDEFYPSQNTGLVKEFLEKARIPYVSVHDGVTWEPPSSKRRPGQGTGNL